MTEEPYEPAHDARRPHLAVMQAVITELAQRSAGRPVPEVVKDLERSLAAQGLPRQPHNWVMAVAQEAANGHVYVESEEALRDAAELLRRDNRTSDRWPNSP